MNVTVYIPDQLYRQLEKHRDRINVSAILQRGLKKELDVLETSIDLSPAEMDRAVQRLLSEKEELEGRTRGRGINEGLKWALSAPYEQLADIERRHRHMTKTVGVSPGRALSLLKKVCPATLSPIDEEGADVSVVEREIYALGVLEGILRVLSRLNEASSNATSNN